MGEGGRVRGKRRMGEGWNKDMKAENRGGKEVEQII